MTASGLAIEHDGHRTRLKWHRLRRRMTDPVFSADIMAEGFRLGASMELDLRVRADGGFVVLHDATLDRETSGSGLVATSWRSELEPLAYTGGDRPLILTEGLAALLRGAHPDALLQFDMKDDLAAIGTAGIDHLASLFPSPPCPIIVSGDSLELIVALRDRLPQLQRGIDPTYKLIDTFEAAGLAAVERELLADLRGPTGADTVYLHWKLVLTAASTGLDLVALCHGESRLVDAWTFTLADPAHGFSDGEWRDFAALMALRPDQITTDEAPATEAAWQQRLQR